MKTIPLRQLASVIGGYAFKSKDFVEQGIPVIKIANVKKRRIDLAGVQFLPNDFLSVNEKFHVQQGDVLICLTGSHLSQPNSVVGRSAIYNLEEIGLLNQRVGKIVPRDRSKADAAFLYYFLSQDTITYELAINAKGSANQANISGGDVERLRVPNYPIDQQIEITKKLKLYDDLIENNRRRIQLLEQSSRLLYKEWFVHLRFPGHEHVKIKDGVPDGWREGVISDFFSTASGGTPGRKNPDYFTGDVPWVKTQELNGGFIISTEEKITEEAIKNSSAKLFPRHTVLVAMYGATIGQLAILSVPATSNQACCALIPKEAATNYVYAYLFMNHHKADIVGLGQGAAQNNISQQIIKLFKMVLPTENLLKLLSESVCPIFDQIEVLQKANDKLAQARDLLLPRLMNGEIAV